ncbi:DNA alkylation repair protein [Dysgonomonas sp. BGC7]|uniref:DNA alkylation repair protein n=1 Tax=Dysgonomonas sp. BGC7 TaxID=1658008 RepID=UPI00068141FA|nr:DNA alkylation repair protein [Dysgonomonas sp. BGC7]MBD8387986.1 DNA alkylation repair protein [Dysgonomonas sp. BGC7]
MQDIIKDIRTRCRLAMNGIASTSMRQRGLVYKVNFGLMIQQIKDMAANYEPSVELAELLWKEDTRELKILATLLYPLSDFSERVANRWLKEISNQEMREQICVNLYQNLPYAGRIALEWADNLDENVRTTGYWLLVRLFLTKKADKVTSHSLDYVLGDVISNNTFLRNAALSVLKHIGRQSKDESDYIVDKLSIYKEDPDPIKQEAYNSIAFEFEYYFEK